MLKKDHTAGNGDAPRNDDPIRAAREAIRKMDEAFEEVARFQKRAYDAYVKVGFNAHQSLYLTGELAKGMIR